MKNVQLLSFIGLTIALSLISCTVKKGVYMSDYHIEWNNNKHNYDKQGLVSKENLYEKEQLQTLTVEPSVNEIQRADNSIQLTVTDDNIILSADKKQFILSQTILRKDIKQLPSQNP